MTQIEQADRLRALLAKATKGPWEVDTEQSEGEYGSAPDTHTGYEDFLIGAEINGKWATLLTTENSTEKLIDEDYDEDYHRAWDVIGEANSALVVAAVNALPSLLDRIEAQDATIARLTAELEATKWQPIETAPKDGTTIDVWRDGNRETVNWGLPPHCCGEMGQYCDSDWHSLKGPGWICSTFGEFVGGKHDPFTHWQPLPTSPSERPGR